MFIKWTLPLASLFLFSGCANLNQNAESIALAYQADPAFSISEETKELVLSHCNTNVETPPYLRQQCYFKGDVLVIERRLRDKRRGWTANSVGIMESWLTKVVCDESNYLENSALNDGLGFMVDLKGGRNGLPTKVISKESCIASEQT
ncbi:hypothetical protein F9L16_04285 [Agarivorans sp. B2Z047]|uniref:hypothetical protein n=1 Tax=Agarivorans sp. B2Z047 TaxID=2652721 RepID=UPI00128DC46A|nr:hypothetical protein [Agarivorans sp. B2Z047]MPW28216.1 hypothetical protein [Agarivorans sp. B2Z047]UQN43954.1 hypothetical protein LQZ07_05650 [Agarivorans sp. B2Z047]